MATNIKKRKKSTARYGIGEWYGRSFVKLTVAERKSLAQRALSHVVRNKETCPACPFQKLPDGTLKSCSKKGGVCSLRLYDLQDDGAVTCSTGDVGKLVTVCPLRFNQDSIVFDWVGKVILETTSTPHVLGEVRFLRRIMEEPEQDESEQEQGKRKEREDVGNIDNVLVHPMLSPIHWCALEIQAVYFSGEKMSELFSHIADWADSTVPFPDRTRRPDFRSSGPKRLMPQLQIKVPTLRRWGKKMAVVVDEQFFKKLGKMEEIPASSDISNCDIVWFVMGFDESQDPIRMQPAFTCLTTLERAVEGLTNGIPVSLPMFEERIRAKLKEKTENLI